jgi:cell division protein FtsQ
MPVPMADPDDDDAPYPGSYSARSGGPGSGNPRFSGGGRFVAESGPWWRPVSTAGRIFLGLGVAAALALVITGYVTARNYLNHDSRFRIAGAGNIEASGLTEVTRAEMLPVFGEDIGRNIFFVPLHERRKQLEAIPWVQRATVMRLLPDRMQVSIVERQPVAFVRQGQQIGLVDADGVLLSMPAANMAKHHYSFPVVTGLDAGDPPAARRLRMAVYGRLMAELDMGNEHLSQQISEIDLTDPEDARVRMPEQGADILAHFGDDSFLERYQRYKSHIAEWRQQYPKLRAVDLRYENQMVLEMTPGTNAVAESVVGDGAPATSLIAAPATASIAAHAAHPKPSAGTPKAVDPDSQIVEHKSAEARPADTHSQAQKAASAKTSSQKTNAVEAMAARQRAAHEKAVKNAKDLKAAREKKDREKKHAAALKVNASKSTSSAHAASAAAQGQ